MLIYHMVSYMFVNNFLSPIIFKSDCHQTLSVIPLVTGDEMIKFWKVKVGVGGMRSTERPSSFFRVVFGLPMQGGAEKEVASS